MKEKILIVGAGLSGSILAYQLKKKNKDITIIDRGQNWSSKIAAGLITPLVFRRMTKSWMVDELMDFLVPFYTSLEKHSNQKILIPLHIRRLLSTEQERDLWLKKEQRQDFERYMYRINDEDNNFTGAKNPFGSARVKSAYSVDINTFFNTMEVWLAENTQFKKEEFEFNQLKETHYKGEEYSKIIFCQGFQNNANPFFKHIPIDPTKGQTLTLKIEGITEDESLNRKCFVQPLGNKTFKIGSTYEWHNTTTNITEEGKEELLNNLSYITDNPYKIVQQEAGVRPTVRDRRPTIGQHFEHKNYYIFNGLGAKGYMLAPYFVHHFCEYLLNGEPLHPEVDIKRFYNKNNA